MTERERVLSILNHRQPDQLPWMADFDYWITGMRTHGTFPEKYANRYADEGLQRLHRDMGTGFYLQGFCPFHTKRDATVDIKVTREGNRQETVMTTPVGTLHESLVFSPTSCSWAS